MTSPPPLVALYVPADRPDRFAKAIGAGTDVVIVDLEDAVAPAHKAAARSAVVELLTDTHTCPVVVRINGADTPWHRDDLTAIAGLPGLAGIRLPKTESADAVRAAADRAPHIPIHALIESALGVENLPGIAHAADIATIGLGEADLKADLGVTDDAPLAWIRARLVITARAAGLPAPMMSVYPSTTDIDGLAQSCRDGKARGFLGRAAIHPRQIQPIRDAFRPTAAEIDHAEQVLQALTTADRTGSGVTVLPGGRMVDAAMLRAAERVIALQAAYGKGI